MQARPGIVFVSTVDGGRRAALAIGPHVWTVAEAWLQHAADQRSPAVGADALGLTALPPAAAARRKLPAVAADELASDPPPALGKQPIVWWLGPSTDDRTN